jgi:hypothetical protein
MRALLHHSRRSPCKGDFLPFLTAAPALERSLRDGTLSIGPVGFVRGTGQQSMTQLTTEGSHCRRGEVAQTCSKVDLKLSAVRPSRHWLARELLLTGQSRLQTAQDRVMTYASPRCFDAARASLRKDSTIIL